MFTRLIRESIFIRVNNLTLNRNIGKFQLSHIWDRVLCSTPGIKVAIPQGNVQHSPYLLFTLQHLGLPLDLMKTIAMVESLSMQNQCSVQRILLKFKSYQPNEEPTQISKLDAFGCMGGYNFRMCVGNFLFTLRPSIIFKSTSPVFNRLSLVFIRLSLVFKSMSLVF